jgi:hypothetical protein
MFSMNEKSEGSLKMPSKKSLSLLMMLLLSVVMAACSGVKGSNVNTGGGSGNNGNGSGSTGTGSGSAGPFTIAGSVVGLQGTGLVIADNGTDTLTIAPGTNGATVQFTFKQTVAGTSQYNVVVQTQPTNPNQTCSVSNPSGTPTANVTNVIVTCGTVFTVGGTVSELFGTGLVLQDNGGDNLTIAPGANPNESFTFATPLLSGTTYTVTILSQPANPTQKCQLVNPTGTISGNVSSVQVVCAAPAFTIGGTLVGLVNGTGDTVELQDNGGDNLLVTGNNTSWQFPSTVTDGGAFNVSIFLQPTSQPQVCNEFFYHGVATGNVSSVIVDCQHNDWTWMFGADAVGGLGVYGTATIPPPALPSANPNTPGGRDFPVTWTDLNGNKWMFGGFGMEVTGKTPPDLPGYLNDLWVFEPDIGNVPTGIWVPANLPITRTETIANGVTTINDVASTVPLQNVDNGQTPLANGQVTNNGGGPGARWGAVSWTDSTGALWMFGGEGISGHFQDGIEQFGLLNDVWKWQPGPILADQVNPTFPVNGYDISYQTPTVNPTTVYAGAYTITGTWTAVSGAQTVNQAGVYAGGSAIPGGRWGAAYTTAPNGTLWVFGGQGYDSTGTFPTLLNDLWSFNGTTWTFVSGSTTGQQNGTYPSAVGSTGQPGGRQTAILWADTSGNLWLFGGLGLDSQGTQSGGSLGGTLPNGTSPNGAVLNDLWEYNIAAGTWTWVSGGNLAEQTGTYGTAQTAAAGNTPGSRWGSSGWIDSNNNLWLYGGWGYGSSLAQSTGFLDDIWQYDPTLNQWIWWKGSSNVNQNGIYPTQFTPSYDIPFVGNVAGGRRGVAMWNQDARDYVWMFGGQGYDSTSTTGNGYLNDFWTYLPFPHYPN